MHIALAFSIYNKQTKIRKRFWPPSTPKLKLPTIRPKLFLRTFFCCRCARIWKSSRLLLTPKTKLLMIFTPRIDNVIHVFSFENSHHWRQELLRLPTKQDVSHFSLQLVSQDSVRELFNHLMTLPYQGVSRIEFHVSCLWIPVVRQGVDCFYSVGLGCSWTFTVIIFNDQRVSTLFVSMYISFA